MLDEIGVEAKGMAANARPDGKARRESSPAGRLAERRSRAVRRRLAADRRACRRKGVRRSGASTLDYVLILGVILPMVAVIIRDGGRAIRLAYEMMCALVSWPFM